MTRTKAREGSENSTQSLVVRIKSIDPLVTCFQRGHRDSVGTPKIRHKYRKRISPFLAAVEFKMQRSQRKTSLAKFLAGLLVIARLNIKCSARPPVTGRNVPLVETLETLLRARRRNHEILTTILHNLLCNGTFSRTVTRIEFHKKTNAVWTAIASFLAKKC